jgi:hypothetical protein
VLVELTLTSQCALPVQIISLDANGILRLDCCELTLSGFFEEWCRSPTAVIDNHD